MMTRETRKSTVALLIALAALAAGCETGFVEDAARDSLAAFLSDVFTTAVNDTIASD